MLEDIEGELLKKLWIGGSSELSHISILYDLRLYMGEETEGCTGILASQKNKNEDGYSMI